MAPGRRNRLGDTAGRHRRRRPRGRVRPAAGRRRGGSPQRRQVDPGEPHPGPPRGRRAGHPRRHPRPRLLRRELARSPIHGAGHRRLGARREGPAEPGGRAGERRHAHRRRHHPGGGLHHRRHQRRRGCGQATADAQASRFSWRPTRSTTRRWNPRPPCCGPWVSANRIRSARCTAEGWPTSSTPCFAVLPEVSEIGSSTGGPRRVALVGKPNVGKSSLLNRLSGDERSVVHDVAGTTVDPVDSLIELDGKLWRFVDTAGLRRKVGQASGHEFYASVRTHGAIDAAEVVVVLIDSSRAVDRAGPAGADDGDRGGSGGRAGVQQVGPDGRGPALPAGPRDRPVTGAGAVGAAGEHLGQDRAARCRSWCLPWRARWRRGTSAFRRDR